jgi:hypothetical protein
MTPYHTPRPVAVIDSRNADGRPVRIHHQCADCGRLVTYSGSQPRHVGGEQQR